MSRRRPSGRGSNSRRFAEVPGPDGSTLRVPQVKDAATFIYLAEPDGSWPRTPAATLLVDASWLVEGATFELTEMRPGKGMGTRTTVQVVEARVEVAVHEGKYAQIKRLLLVDPVEGYDDLMTTERSAS